MKKLFITILTPLVLTGCFGGDVEDTPTTVSDPNYSAYDHTDFSIQYPNDWEILNASSFTSNMPNDTIMGIRNNIKGEIFTANVNISKAKIEKDTTSKDFAKSVLINNNKSLLAFKETGKENYTLPGTEIDTYITEFEGKKKADEPILHFQQLCIVLDGSGYTITGAYMQNEDESVVKNVDVMLHSFAIK